MGGRRPTELPWLMEYPATMPSGITDKQAGLLNAKKCVDNDIEPFAREDDTMRGMSLESCLRAHAKSSRGFRQTAKPP